ncbi:MAG TPA: ROK family transcriptional regulator [Ktedonobacterales bacterium]
MTKTVRHIVRSMRARDVRQSTRPATSRGADLRLMRELNRLLILNGVRVSGPITRVAVAHRTGLSRTTVSSIVDELLADNLLFEGKTVEAAPTGGRRATLLHFNADAGYVIGVDLGRSHLTLLLTNLAGQIIARRSGPFDASLGPEVCLQQVIASLMDFTAEHHIGWHQIIGVGLGIPGPMDAASRMLVRPPRMPGWDQFDIRAVMERACKVPIYLDNDANMGARGESQYGAARHVEYMAYVKVATGIGCGLIMNGDIYRGAGGTAGELGHVTIDDNGPLCDCGNRGCLEVVAGAAAVTIAAARGVYPDSGGTSAGPLDVADVVQAALAGDTVAQEAIERAGYHIGIALAGLVNIFNPSLILLDGSMARAGEFLVGPIREGIARRSLAASSAATRIEMAQLGDNAIALGAVATVIEAAFGPPSLTTMPALAAGDFLVAAEGIS